MKKTFVLDANVLLHDSQSIHAFKDNDVVIILAVLAEVDSFKKHQGEIGVNAREVARELDRLSKVGNLSKGVGLEEGGNLFVYSHHPYQVSPDIKNNVDGMLISETGYLRSQGQNAIIVSKDIMLRVIATTSEIPAEDYETDSKHNEIYTGISKIVVNQDFLNRFAKEGEIFVDDQEFYPNQYVHMTSEIDEKKSLLGRANADGKIVIIHNKGNNMLNIKPRNMEQIFASNALMDDDIKLVTLQGMAGTGKTLISVAAAISKIMDDSYSKLVITRPIIPVGKDLGFLPGSAEEKMQPWMQPIFDAIDMIKETDRKSAKTMLSSKFSEDGLINIAPLTYLRGRSIPHSFMLIDEAQNISPQEIKTIVTRCGEGTKMVFTGDVDQIDNPFLDRKSNGLTYLISKFKSYDIHAHIQLNKGERSRLAEIAAEIL